MVGARPDCGSPVDRAPCGGFFGPKNLSGRLEVKILFPIPWTEPQFLGRPADGLVTILTELSQLLYLCRRNIFMYCRYIERNTESHVLYSPWIQYYSSGTCVHFLLCGLHHLFLRKIKTHMQYSYGTDLSSCHHLNQPESYEMLKICPLRKSTSLGPFIYHETQCWAVARRASTYAYNRHCAYANGFTILAEDLGATIQRTAAINSSMSFWWGKQLLVQAVPCCTTAALKNVRHFALGCSEFVLSAGSYWTGPAFSVTCCLCWRWAVCWPRV